MIHDASVLIWLNFYNFTVFCDGKCESEINGGGVWWHIIEWSPELWHFIPSHWAIRVTAPGHCIASLLRVLQGLWLVSLFLFSPLIGRWWPDCLTVTSVLQLERIRPVHLAWHWPGHTSLWLVRVLHSGPLIGRSHSRCGSVTLARDSTFPRLQLWI